jgi:8-oxo-dGTP diphosphatase
MMTTKGFEGKGLTCVYFFQGTEKAPALNSNLERNPLPITVTAACTLKDDSVLICRRAMNQKLAGFWELPGGKVEEGESYAECLARELFEELGVETVVGSVVAESTHAYDSFTIRLVLLETTIVGGEITLSVHDRYEWVPVGELLHWKLAPADIPLARRIVEIHSEGSCG